MWKSWKRQDTDGDKTEYDAYMLSGKELFFCLGKGIVVTGVFAYVFYRSFWGLSALPFVFWLLLRRERTTKIRERKERLSLQFTDTVLAVSAGMQAGRAAENAFLEAEREIRTLYGKECEMAKELALLRKGLKNQLPLEELLRGLGERSHVEEIRDFTEVFAVAKRLGGNLSEIIGRTAQLTQQRMEVEREIQTLLSAKKYEQKVMIWIPFLLFGYMQMSSPGFFDVLYHNAAGVLIMSVCLALYLSACALGERFMDIRV